MKIEFVISKSPDHANHMVWTIPDEDYDPDWFPAIVKAISGLVEWSGREHLDDEPATNGDYPCLESGCGRSFPTQQGLSMHKTRTHDKKF
jgi:hypothetical protein